VTPKELMTMTTTNEEILKALDELKAASTAAKNILKGGPGSGPHKGGGGGSGASGRAPSGLVEQTRSELKGGLSAMPKDVQARAAKETEDDHGSAKFDHLSDLSSKWQEVSNAHAAAGEVGAARAASDLANHVKQEAFNAVESDPMPGMFSTAAQHDAKVGKYTDTVAEG